MVIYGGIFEVTKELNDMHVFDMEEEIWTCLFEELNSTVKMGMGGSGGPVIKKSITKVMNPDNTLQKQSTLNARRTGTSGAFKGKRKHKPTITTVGVPADDREI